MRIPTMMVAVTAAMGATIDQERERCKVTGDNVKRGLKVRRGPSWEWGQQDAEEGGVLISRAIGCKGKDKKSKTMGWWKVRWGTKTKTNTYRVGCDSKFDLALWDCGERADLIAASCSFNDLYWPEGALPKDDNNTCVRDGIIAPEGSCTFERSGYTCDTVTCTRLPNTMTKSVWSTARPTCRPDGQDSGVQGCRFDALSPPQGAAPSGQFQGCIKGGVVAVGDLCMFKREGHSCEVASCVAGAAGRGSGSKSPAWSTTTPTCKAVDARKVEGCPFDQLTVPAGAKAEGDGCTTGGTVPRGLFCTYRKDGAQCEVSACTHELKWTQTAPTCKTVGCPFEQITVPSGATPSGEDCAPGASVRKGSFCSFLKEGHTCDLIICGEQWSQTKPSCRPSEVRPDMRPAVTPAKTHVSGSEPCLTNMQMSGNRVGNVVMGAAFPESNAAECQKRCTERDGCKCFSFAGHNSRCTLLTQCDTPTPRTSVFQYVSGFADCRIVKESSDACRLEHSDAKTGAKVKRGPHWLWGDQDGQSVGIVLEGSKPCSGGKWLKVRWEDTGIENFYRAGCNKRYDLCPQETVTVAATAAVVPVGRGGAGRGLQLGASRGTGASRGSAEPVGRGTSGRGTSEGRGAAGGRGLAGGSDMKCTRGVKLDGSVLFSLDSVSVESNCKQYCLRMPECIGVTYDSAKSTCDLISGSIAPQGAPAWVTACRREGVSVSVDGKAAKDPTQAAQVTTGETPIVKPVLLGGFFQCMAKRTFAGGDLFHFKDVTERVECQEYCGKVPECVAIVHNAEKKTCMLKAYLTSPQATESQDTEACVRVGEPVADESSDGKFECKQGMQVVGTELMLFNDVATHEACTDYCARVEDCTAVSFKPNGTSGVCALRGGSTALTGGTTDMVGCLKPGIKPIEAKLSKSQDAAPIMPVSRRGQTLQVGGQECTDGQNWQVSVGPPLEYFNPGTGETTTERPLCLGYECQLNSNIVGGDWFRLVGIETVAQCEEVCNNIPTCVGFVHRAACPSLNKKITPLASTPRCKTCDIKGVVGEIVPDDHARKGIACKSLSTERTPCAQRRVRVVLKVSGVDCTTTVPFPTTTDRDQFLANFETSVEQIDDSWTVNAGDIPAVIVEDELCCTRGQEDYEQDFIYQQKACTTITSNQPVAGTGGFTRLVLSFAFPSGPLEDLVAYTKQLETWLDTANIFPWTTTNTAVEPICADGADATGYDCSSVDQTGNPDNKLFVEEQVRTIQECINKCEQFGAEGPTCAGVAYVAAEAAGTCTLFAAPLLALQSQTGSVFCAAPSGVTPQARKALQMSVVLPMTSQEFVERCQENFISSTAEHLAPLFPADSGFSREWVSASTSDASAERRASGQSVPAGVHVKVSVSVPAGKWSGVLPSEPSLSHQQAVMHAALASTRRVQPHRYRCQSEHGWEGTELWSRSKVKSADECFRFCAAEEKCHKVAFIQEDVPRCVLFGAGAVRSLPPTSSFLACEQEEKDIRTGQTDYECSAEGEWMGGDLLVLGNVAVKEDCQRLCETISADCDMYVHSPAGTCVLKNSGESMLEKNGKSKGETCRAVTSSAESGFVCRSGEYVGGDVFQIEGVATLRECQQYCSTVDRCSVITWDVAQRCQLKTADSVILSKSSSEAVSCTLKTATAAKAAQEPYKCQTDFSYIGSQLMEVKSVADVEECIAACTKLEDCVFVSHGPNGCQFFTRGAKLLPETASVACERQVKSDATAANERHAVVLSMGDVVEEAYACQEGVTYQGGTLQRTEDVASSEMCLQLCSSHPECKTFVYDVERVCWLKAATAESVAAAAGRIALACTRRTEVPPSRIKGGVLSYHCSVDSLYTGGDIAVFANVPSAPACQARCSDEPECSVAVRTPQGTCYLKSRNAAAVPRRVVEALLARSAPIVEIPPAGLACVRDLPSDATPQNPLAAAGYVEGFECEANHRYVGGELLQLAEVSGEECQRQCLRVPECATVVFSADRVCSLRTSAAAAVREQQSASVACTRSFASEGPMAAASSFRCASHGGLEGGFLLAVDDVRTAADCLAHCSLVMGCGAVAHTRKGTCVLHALDATFLPVSKESDDVLACKLTEAAARLKSAPGVSASKPPAFGWSCAQQDLEGGDLFVMEGVASVRQCQQQCSRVPNCASITFSAANFVCTLKSAAATPVVASNVVGCLKIENPRPAEGASVCLCAENWIAPEEGGMCGKVQRGCPAVACDGGGSRWCRVANPGCATMQHGDWSYCDDNTQTGREGVLVDTTSGGEQAPEPEYQTHTIRVDATQSLGFTVDTQGRITNIVRGTDAETAMDENGVQLEVGQVVVRVAGCAVQSYTPKAGCDLDREASWLSTATPSDLIAAYAPRAQVEVSVRREASPGGKVWYMHLAHALQVPHLSAPVFNGNEGVNHSDSVEGVLLNTRIRTALNSFISPSALARSMVVKCVADELQRPHGLFYERVNSALRALELPKLGGDEAKVTVVDSVNPFSSRLPKLSAVIAVDMKSTDLVRSGDAIALRTALAKLLDMPFSQVEAVRADAMSADDQSVPLSLCRYGYGGPLLGCLDRQGLSIYDNRVKATEAGESDPYAAGGALEDPEVGAPVPVAKFPAGFSPVRSVVTLVAHMDQPISLTTAGRMDFAQTTKDRLTTLLGQVGDSPSEGADALRSMEMTGGSVEVQLERADAAPSSCEPESRAEADVKVNIGATKRHGEGLQVVEPSVTPTLDLPPAETVSTGARRHLLQYNERVPKGATRPVIDSAGQTVYDPLRRFERMRAIEHHKEICKVGIQGPAYGLMSGAYDLDGQPIRGTLSACIRACELADGCVGFSRENLGTSSDEQESECYLKRTVLPYCGDQYSFEDWGTYVITCRQERPCAWTEVPHTSLQVVDEYNSHSLASPQQCRDLCEQLPDCLGVSWNSKDSTCYLVHEQQGRNVADDSFTSFVCKRKASKPVATTSDVTPIIDTDKAAATVAEAWMSALLDTLQDCSDRQGGCFRFEAERVDLRANTLRPNDCPGGVCGLKVQDAPEMVDVSVSFYPVQAEIAHVVAVSLTNITLSALVAEEGGIAADPLARIGELLTDEMPLTVVKVCAQETRTGESLICFDGADAPKPEVLRRVEEQCAESGCVVVITVELQVNSVTVHRLLRMPGGEVMQLAPGDRMPSGTRIVESLGDVVDEFHMETARGNNALANAMRSRKLSFVAEAVQLMVEHSARGWASDMGAVLVDSCHTETRAPTVDCSVGHCRQSEISEETLRATSCSGTPVCGPAECNFHGEPSGFAGSCQCQCGEGYAGARCQQCDVGFFGYPACASKTAQKMSTAVPVPPPSPPSTPPPAVPSDKELDRMTLDQVAATANRLGLSGEGFRKQDYIAAIHALRRTTESTEPGETLEPVPFHLASVLGAQQMHWQAESLRATLAGLTSNVGGLSLRILWVCNAVVCSPECPNGRVHQWSEKDRTECVAPGQDGSNLIRTGGSVVEFEATFASGSDVVVRAAVAEALLSKTATLPNSPLVDFGVLAVTHADSALEANEPTATGPDPWIVRLCAGAAFLSVVLAGIARLSRPSRPLPKGHPAAQLDCERDPAAYADAVYEMQHPAPAYDDDTPLFGKPKRR
eukprot:Hpha_TRINITY_DN15640_c8_g1::TRINITY_DN15640_c8_g1_i2::g.97857::m.97857